MNRTTIILSLIALFIWACAGEPDQAQDSETGTPEPVDQVVDNDPAIVGHNVVSLVELNLKVALKSAMKQQGPVAAIKVCNESALEITAGLNDSLNVNVGRTSLKYRNPQNQPTEVEEQILKDFAVDDENAAKGRIVESEEGVGYYSKIMMKPFCLTCHGSSEQIMPEVAAVLDSLYPNDLATGYEAGQLRGMWTVKFNEE